MPMLWLPIMNGVWCTFYSYNCDCSGAGTILGQGGKTKAAKVCLQREIRFFAEIGLLFVPKTSVLYKKEEKKKKKGLHRN